jgi:hypothetical protein
MNKVDWSNLYKIKIANSNKSFQKHEIVKLLIVMKLLEKHKKHKAWIRIYTEFEMGGRKCDIYFENIKTKEAYAYEIQNRVTKEWLEKANEYYINWNAYFMKTSDFVLVSLARLSDDINKLNEELEEYIF